MDHKMHSNGDSLFDSEYNNKNINKPKVENISDNDQTNDRTEHHDNIGDIEEEEEDQDSIEEEEDEPNRDELDDNSDEFNNTRIDLSFDNNYENDFDDEEETHNGTHILQYIQRSKPSNSDTTDGDRIFSEQVIGRSADGFNHYEFSPINEKVKDIHGNKVNIEVDPQQPSYDEAIASIVDEMGGIHIQDGPGGSFALPDRNQIHLQESILNYNDKDFGFIEKMAADRRPIVRVTRVRKRVRTDGLEDNYEDTEKKSNFASERNIKNQYIPVIVMDKEDMDTGKEEKIRRYRSDNDFKKSESEDNPTSLHFQNQKLQQQQHFHEQSRQKMTLNGAIPIAVPDPQLNKSLELRGFVATRDNAGKMIAIPIFRDMINVDSTQTNRRKRVRVVHRVVNKSDEPIAGNHFSVETVRQNRNEKIVSQSSPPKSSKIRANPLPRILVPDQNNWLPHLPFYGPSLSQIRKIQLLPPIGPIPVQKDEPKPDLMSVFRPKPKPKLTHYLVENNDKNRNTFDIFEKRVSKPETTSRSALTTNQRPKQTNKRPKNKQKSIRNHSSNGTTTTRQALRPAVETTTPSFIEISLTNNSSQLRGQSRPTSEHVRMKLTRNGKRIGQRDNNSTQTTPSPIRATTSRINRQRERLVLSNAGAQPLNSLDYYELPYFENSSNQTITYFNEELSPTTTTASPRHKQTSNKRRQRPKKGSSASPSRPAPVYPTPAVLSTATKCTTSKCRLPDCFCGGTASPNGMSVQDIPQMVMITFDDSVNDLNWEIYEEVFTGRQNPNGCPILGTFYVSHEWTDYGQVQSLYSYGHEMASHSITHSFGEKFSVQKWNKEVNGQREILHLYGGVNLADVRGMRAPFLQGGGNKQFEMLYESNFTYDSTMPVFENSPPFWPYTLDYAINHECMIAPCPTKSFPGVWEVGMVMWHDLKGGRCSMGDACSNPSDEEGVQKMLMKNFNRHYQSNRAPFGLYYHSAWFNTPHHRRGFMAFLDEILTKKDVYFVTKYQMIQWIRNPTPVSQIDSFGPWSCNYEDRPPPCKSPTVCNVGSKSGSRFLKTCQPCPDAYPWVGNTGFTPTNV